MVLGLTGSSSDSRVGTDFPRDGDGAGSGSQQNFSSCVTKFNSSRFKEREFMWFCLFCFKYMFSVHAV